MLQGGEHLALENLRTEIEGMVFGGQPRLGATDSDQQVRSDAGWFGFPVVQYELVHCIISK